MLLFLKPGKNPVKYDGIPIAFRKNANSQKEQTKKHPDQAIFFMQNLPVTDPQVKLPAPF